MKVIEFNKTYSNQVNNLLIELQEYIVSLDNFKLNIITKEYKDKYLEITLKEVYNNNGKMYLAVENNDVLGMICGYICSYSEEDKMDYKCPKIGIVSELIVDKNERKGGVGQKLLDKMEEYFKQNACEYIKIDVFAPNNIARNFYNKNGYIDRLITVSKKI